MHSFVPYIFLGFVVCSLIVAALRSQRSSLKLTQRNWNDLIAEIEHVDSRGVTCVAIDYLDPRKGQIDLEPEAIWNLLGGDEGLRRMRDNANRLVTLAAFAQQWNLDESVIVAERMRRDGLRLRRAVRRIQLGMASQFITGKHWVEVPFQLQEAASAYYLMRQRLLALYESSHVGLHPMLAQAL